MLFRWNGRTILIVSWIICIIIMIAHFCDGYYITGIVFGLLGIILFTLYQYKYNTKPSASKDMSNLDSPTTGDQCNREH